MRAAAEASASAAVEAVKGEEDEARGALTTETKKKVTSSGPPSLAQQLWDYKLACSASRGRDALAEAWSARTGGGASGGERGSRRQQQMRQQQRSSSPPPLQPSSPTLPILEWSDAVDAAADEIAEDVVRDVAWEVAGAVGSLVEESWRSELLPRWT
jgi:hypothetical protein